MRRAVTSQAELRDATRNQQTWIRRAMRRMTGNAALGLHRRVLVNERALLVCVTLDASGVSTGGQSCLLKLETAVRIVAIAALHCAFQHLVMERQVELVLRFTMTTETKLRLAGSQQLQIGDTRLLRVCFGDEHIRRGELPATRFGMRRVTVSATDVVAPVFAAAEVVVFFPAGVAAQACL